MKRYVIRVNDTVIGSLYAGAYMESSAISEPGVRNIVGDKQKFANFYTNGELIASFRMFSGLQIDHSGDVKEG